MSRQDDLYDQAMRGLVSRVSGRSIAVIAVLSYAGLGLALPLSLSWSVPWLVDANVIGTVLAGSACLGWLGIQIQARDRRHLIEWTTDLRRLDSAEFEWLVGELFRREGWTVTESGRRDGPDGNIDLALVKDGTRRIVQCKRWTSWVVGVDDIRGFAGTLLREGMVGRAGVFVTLSEFSAQARAEAARTGIALVDNQDLYSRVEKARRVEPCPVCQASMHLDRSPRGWWFRCIATGCAGKRDLGRDPAAAVELLTELR